MGNEPPPHRVPTRPKPGSLWEQQLKRRRRRRVALGLGAAALALAGFVAFPTIEAALWMAGFEGGALPAAGTAEVNTRAETLAGPDGPISALVVTPPDEPAPPGVVLLPGLHKDGIHEPRLVRYAQRLADAGLLVVVPEVAAFSDWRVDDGAVAAVHAVLAEVARRTGRTRAGLVGVSFGGGLALRAACEGDAPVSATLSLGGYHDLQRVVRWYAGAALAGPDGPSDAPAPSPYGAHAMLHGYAGEVFGDDAELARALLDVRLAGGRDAELDDARTARPEALARVRKKLTPAARGEAVRALAGRHEAALARVSPAGALAACERALFHVHGERDDVIPTVEARWVAHEQPAATVVVTPYLDHADVRADVTWEERLALVGVLRDFLAAVRAAPRA